MVPVDPVLDKVSGNAADVEHDILGGGGGGGGSGNERLGLFSGIFFLLQQAVL